MDANANGKTMKVVYTVSERNGRSFWTRVGVGFENRDGSLNLRLDAIPTNGTLQVREWDPEKDRRPDLASTSADGGPPRPAIRRRDEAIA